MVNIKVIRTSDYKTMLANNPFVISYAYCETRFGKGLIGMAGKCVCHLSFVNTSPQENLRVLKEQWPGADLIEDEDGTAAAVSEIFDMSSDKLEIIMKGTPFQEKVWKGLLQIPEGQTCSYEALAQMIGCPKAVRAAANAIAKNPVAYVVPCHRVISKSGEVHKYGWGPEIKKQILEFEKSHSHQVTSR